MGPTATDLTDTAMLPVPTVTDTATTRDPLMPRLLTVTDTLPVPTATATDLTTTAMLPVPTATTTKLSKTSPSSILLSANQKTTRSQTFKEENNGNKQELRDSNYIEMKRISEMGCS